MHCLNEEHLPFKAVLNCDLEDQRHLEWTLNVYPAKLNTKTTFDTKDRFIAISINDLTEFYDLQSKEYKNRENIKFTMKIVNQKLDEIAKNADVESGVEDEDDSDTSFEKVSNVKN